MKGRLAARMPTAQYREASVCGAKGSFSSSPVAGKTTMLVTCRTTKPARYLLSHQESRAAFEESSDSFTFRLKAGIA